MLNAFMAEWVLSLVTPPDRAASTVGDLLEEASTRSMIWFWSSVLWTAASHIWGDLRAAPGRMIWLVLSGLLEFFIVGFVVGFVLLNYVIRLWVDTWPYQYGPNAVYIPPWGFYGILIAVNTAVPLIVGLDIGRRSKGREAAAGVALTSVLAALVALRVILAGTVEYHQEYPYPYEQNRIVSFCVTALCVMVGTVLFRVLAQRNRRSAPHPTPPRPAH